MRTIVKSTMLTALILISILAGCKDDDDIVVKVTSVTLNKTMLTLTEGGSETITATIEPQDATNKTVTWRSSNLAIATVDNKGKVTAIKKGDATITVTTKDGNKTATCKVSVTPKVIAVTDVNLNKTTMHKVVGESEQLTATIIPQNATNKNVKWTSSDNTIASVDNTGMVTAIKEGNTAITVTTEDGNKTATCKISVKTASPKVKMTLVTTKSVGEQIKLVTRANANDQNSVWIDLNNNGTKDANEEITNFTDTVSYTIGAQTINIYGKVTEFDCEKNDLTVLKVDQNEYLTYLACRENQITQLDVKLNKKLKTLYCLRNPLQQLDVTQNIELIDLNCRYTQLQQLDVSKNKKLKILDCSYTSLGRLDVSNNKQLRGIYCKEIGLKELDVTQNKELEELECYGNYINNLNLKNNTKLKILGCYKNSLKNLDVTSNKNLIDLSCGENPLTKLDVSSNKKLIYLWCTDSPNLSSLNVANGNNENFKYPYGDGDYIAFNSSNCPKLTCIQVDKDFNPDAQTDTGKKWKKDDSASWNNSGDSCEDLFGTQMTIVTTKTVGEQIKLLIKANANDQNNVWIDLNNNGTKDNNEKITNFTDTISYTINAQTINIYGKITKFDCQKNDLTELEVGQNEYLTYLACMDNQITQLDVSQNKKLKYLYCLRTPLQQLDVTQNTELTDLNCRYTQLQQLDVSKNKKLKYLSCSYTSIGWLDVTNNQQLIGLYCKKIGLKELDVAQNKELIELVCFDNYISSLNLKNNTKLKKLECTINSLNTLDVSSNKNLIYLSCGENPLTQLDVSSNEKLVFLWCADSPKLNQLNVANGNNENFKYPYDGDPFTFNSSNCPKLTCIQVDKGFNPDAQTGIGQKWKKDDSASWNNSGDSCEDLFGTKMTLVTTRYEGEQIKLLIKADANNQNSVWIDLNNNGTKDADEKVTNFTDTVSYTINAQIINIYGKITKFDCQKNDLTELEVGQNKYLTYLACRENQITKLDVSLNKNLKTLYCLRNPLQQLDVTQNIELIDLNCRYTQLQQLDVSENKKLKYLSCSYTSIGWLDVTNNKQLIGLYCKKIGLKELDITQNKELRELVCFDNFIYDLNLKNNTKLKKLECSKNSLNTLDVTSNKELIYLSCNENSLTELDVSSNKKLIYLWCTDSPNLSSLNVANGNNENFKYPYGGDYFAFNSSNCTSLTCIQVDKDFNPDAQTGIGQKWKKDDSASWNNSGNPCK